MLSPTTRPTRKPYRLQLEPLEDRLTPATYHITGAGRFDDGGVTAVTPDGSGGFNADNLRSAIVDANARAGADVIILETGTYHLTITGSGEDNARTGDLDVTDDLTIQGNGPGNTIIDAGSVGSGSGLGDRVFHILTAVGSGSGSGSGAAPPTVFFAGITIQRGAADGGSGVGGGILNEATLTLTNVKVTDNSADKGGGIYHTGGKKLTIQESTVSLNEARKGAGLLNNSGTVEISDSEFSDNDASVQGGGLINTGTSMDIKRSIFTGNTAGSTGGAGIYNRAPLTLTDVTISDNESDGDGGGISNTGGGATANLTRVKILDNTADADENGAGDGGGIYNDGSATMTVADSTIAGNSAVDGGGAYNEGKFDVTGSTFSTNHAVGGEGSPGNGGAIWGYDGNVTLTNTTISKNDASSNGGAGGGIFRDIGSAIGSFKLLNVTMYQNEAEFGGNIAVGGEGATITLKNTIVAGSHLLGGNADFGDGGTIISEGNNLEDANDLGLTGPNDLINTNPLLGPLQDNGGPTQTHALLAGSPAIDTANNTGAPPSDQRGVARPQDGNGDGVAVADRGAFEFIPAAPTAVDLGASMTLLSQGPGKRKRTQSRTRSTRAGRVGRAFTFLITIRNNGPGTATGVVYTNPIPQGVTFVGLTSSQGTFSVVNGEVAVGLGTMPSGSTATILITFQRTRAGTFVNAGRVNTPQVEITLVNNSASATAVGGIPLLASDNLQLLAGLSGQQRRR